ncbi:hypothetical protein [Polaromonas sp. CG_9.11]|uniref:hypothetical protein n=1 Tax=Polaromonas sp. CG_9.11 TaxID=2787730 RepID=UPI0018C95815|nr:hypothetical protein [Polaromonas sp. CG_9.11]MBG6076074.1 hypothetical protein [Polaromonas sp. CG_9.11]
MNEVSSAKKLIFQAHPATSGTRGERAGAKAESVEIIVTLGEGIVGYIQSRFPP